jgi:hypothetical protein
MTVDSDVAVALDRTSTLMQWKDGHEIRHRDESAELDQKLNGLGSRIEVLSSLQQSHEVLSTEWLNGLRTADESACERLEVVEKRVSTNQHKLDKFTWITASAIVVLSTIGKALLDVGIEFVKHWVPK